MIPALHVRCPHCQRELGVPRKLLGRDMTCPICQTVFTIGVGPTNHLQTTAISSPASPACAGEATVAAVGVPTLDVVLERGREGAVQRLRRATPWSLSAGVHAVLLVALAGWMLPMRWKPAVAELVASCHDLPDEPLDELATTVLETTRTDAAADPRPSAQPLDAASVDRTSETFAVFGASATAPLAATALSWRGLTGQELGQEVEVRAEPTPVEPGGGIRPATNAQSALDAVLDDIPRHATQGDLLVVWLFDASLSLVDDREQIARRLKLFYNEEIERRDPEKSYLVQSTAVAFGAVPVELLKPTRHGGHVAAVVRKVPIDETGLENVMTAVQSCVARYRQKSKTTRRNMRIVIWTDESGNDLPMLEDTIALCRSEGVVVSVVGPSAVLGAQGGLHHYRDPATGEQFLLPVDRGPDSALPERAILPFWFDDSLSPWQQGGALAAKNSKWYGGSHREGLLSGHGPYALTRLALQTGGTFTLLDRPGDGVRFSPEKMRDYRPEYESLADYRRSLEDHPLRRAVAAAVLRTYQRPILQAPPLEFMVKRSDYYPFNTFKISMPPPEFHLKLAVRLAAERQAAAAALQTIEWALAAFEAEGLEAEHPREPSPRWRAWYDVTRGRLLANVVRFSEYQRVCDAVLTGAELAPQTNWMALRASDALRGGEPVEAQAREARRLLTRCIEQHRDTPWAYLAQWELDQPLGLRVMQDSLPPPAPYVPGPPAPAINLPKF